jgi:hypothetical protein
MLIRSGVADDFDIVGVGTSVVQRVVMDLVPRSPLYGMAASERIVLQGGSDHHEFSFSSRAAVRPITFAF